MASPPGLADDKAKVRGRPQRGVHIERTGDDEPVPGFRSPPARAPPAAAARQASARAGGDAAAAARGAGQPAARRWRTAARLEFESRANQAARVNQPVSESSKSTWETDSDSRAFPPTRRGRRIGPIIRVGVGSAP